MGDDSPASSVVLPLPSEGSPYLRDRNSATFAWPEFVRGAEHRRSFVAWEEASRVELYCHLSTRGPRAELSLP